MKNLEQHTPNIRRFLFGTADEQTSNEIRKLILSDADFYEAVELVEQEIFDEYAAGKLSADERHRVEFFYGATEGGRKDLEFAQNLYRLSQKEKKKITGELSASLLPVSAKSDQAAAAKAAKAAATGAASELPQPADGFFNEMVRKLTGYRSLLVPALGLFLLIFALSVYLVVLRNEGSLSSSELSALNKKSHRELLDKFGGAEHLTEAELKPDPVRAFSAPLPEIDVARKNAVLLKLTPAVSGAGKYRAEFFDDEGSKLFEVSDLVIKDGGGSGISIFIPAANLKRGDYLLRLQGETNDGSPVESGNFSFRVK